MRIMAVAILVLAIGWPVMAQGDAKPPAEPPPAEPPPAEPPPTEPPPTEEPPDESPSTPLTEEQIRLRLVEKDAKEAASMLKRRMEAAKTDADRATAIADVCAGSKLVAHPIMVAALLPYLNPRQIRAGLTYGDGTINAALGALRRLQFDETYFGIMKMVDANLTNDPYVIKLISIFGEIKNPKSVPGLVKMARDKREGNAARCKVAVDQLGKIGHRDAISELIAELEEQDKAGVNDVKMKDRRSKLNAPVIDALKKITGQTLRLGSEYRSWWIKNAETFQKEKKIVPPDPGGDDK